MRWKALLAASLLVLSITLTAVAVNQIQNGNRTSLNEMNDVNQSQNEMGVPSIETNTVDQSRNENSPSTSKIQVETTRYPFKLTMTLDKTEFTLGEAVKITLRLENIGNGTILLFFDDGSEYLNFIVYNETNSVVWNDYENKFFPAFMAPPTFMEPGEEYVITRTWYQKDGLVYQGLDEDPVAYYTKVPPGTYYIVGALSRRAGSIVETPPITITILGE